MNELLKFLEFGSNPHKINFLGEWHFYEITIIPKTSARGGIRTLEILRYRILSPAPLTWLGNPRIEFKENQIGVVLNGFI